MNGIIGECFNSGQINGNQSIGGIVGGLWRSAYNNVLEKCYNAGDINGNSAVGGILGTNQGETSSCYNKGNVSGGNMVGGIVGNNQGILNNSYNIRNISGNVAYVGGIAGQNDGGSIKNTYSLEGTCTNIIGSNLNNGIIETSEIKAEQDMKVLATILGDAFEEDEENLNNGYPVLKWQVE